MCFLRQVPVSPFQGFSIFFLPYYPGLTSLALRAAEVQPGLNHARPLALMQREYAVSGPYPGSPISRSAFKSTPPQAAIHKSPESLAGSGTELDRRSGKSRALGLGIIAQGKAETSKGEAIAKSSGTAIGGTTIGGTLGKKGLCRNFGAL